MTSYGTCDLCGVELYRGQPLWSIKEDCGGSHGRLACSQCYYKSHKQPRSWQQPVDVVASDYRSFKLVEEELPEPPESFPPDSEDGTRESLGFVLSLLGVGALIGAGALYVVLRLWF